MANSVPSPVSVKSDQPRVRKVDLSTRAYEAIRNSILNLTFHPGDVLREVALAEQLGMSRTPVRAALRRLEANGYVSPDPVRGYVVAQISLQDVEDAYQVIEVLEGLASQLAAQRRSEAHLSSLRTLTATLTDAAASGDLEAWMAVDNQFHQMIREAAGNTTLNQLSQLPYSIIERVRHMHMREKRDPERLALETDAHKRIAKAIADADGAGAEALTRQIFSQARDANIELLRKWVLPLRRTF